MSKYERLELGRKGMDGSYVELGKTTNNGSSIFQVFSWKPRGSNDIEQNNQGNEECMWDREFSTEDAARKEFSRFS